MNNCEWLKQLRLQDLRCVTPSRVLQLIDGFYADLRLLNQQLKDGKISEHDWFYYKRDMFWLHCNKLRELNRTQAINDKTFNRVMSILCEEDEPLVNLDYKLLKKR